MARPKEKTSTAFDQKCLAAAKKLASFQASSLKDDIERLYTDELLADLSVDLGNRKCALHRCILKARNADLYNYLTSEERNDTSEVSVVTHSHSTDIENCLRSLYRDDDVSTTVEKLDQYFHPVANSEIVEQSTDSANESNSNVGDFRQETVIGDDIHVISENITNTSLDLVKNEAGYLNRGVFSCNHIDVESNQYSSSCDRAKCEEERTGSKQDNSIVYDKTEAEGEAVRNTLLGCDKSKEECGWGRGSDEDSIYILAGRIVEQVIIEARNIVANVNVDKSLDEIAKKSESAKDNESVIKCNNNAEFENSVELDAGIEEGQKLESCSLNSRELNSPIEKQKDQTKSSTFSTIRKNEESIQRLLERVYGIKPVMKSFIQLDEPCSQLGEDLLRMLLEHDNTDCTIEVQGEIFPAHRCILAARSSYFAAMLGGSWRESDGEKIVLDGVVPSVLKQTLLYLYGGVIQVYPLCPLGGLIMMADMYGMEGLKEVVAFNLNVEYCHFFHRPCPECIAGVPEALALTMMYNMDAMKEKCVRWINKNFGKVWASKSLATLPQEVLEFTVSSAIKDLALNNVLDVLVDCQRLNEKTPHLKWTEPVFDMITQLMDAAIEFASQNFINLISGNTFKNIDKEGINFNKQPLEDIFGMIIQALSPENACLAYLSLHGWVKSTETAAEEKIPQYSEEFVEFVNTLFKKCKEHLCLYIHQVANTAKWDLLSKDMQQSIMQDANYVCIDTNRGRMARPKLTSMQKKISATSPLSLKEYFDCHFGQAKPPVRNPKSRKDNLVDTKNGKPLPRPRETTKGAKGKDVPRPSYNKTMSAEKSGAKTIKQISKNLGKHETDSTAGKKGTRGKPVTVAGGQVCPDGENVGTEDKSRGSHNLLGDNSSFTGASVCDTGCDCYVNDTSEIVPFDIHAIGDIELVDLAPGLVFEQEKPMPVFVVNFVKPEQSCE